MIRYPRVYNGYTDPDSQASPGVRVFSFDQHGNKPGAHPPLPYVPKPRPPWRPDPPPAPCVICSKGEACLIHRAPRIELRCAFGGKDERTPVNEHVEYHLLRADIWLALSAYRLWPWLATKGR